MPARSLFLVERLAAAVLLDQTRHDQLGGLEGGEAFTAGQALAAPAHLIALGDQSRVNHFGVMGTAEGTMHGAGTGVAEGSRMVAHPRPAEHPQNRAAPARWERREESDVAAHAKRDKNHTLRYTSAAPDSTAMEQPMTLRPIALLAFLLLAACSSDKPKPAPTPPAPRSVSMVEPVLPAHLRGAERNPEQRPGPACRAAARCRWRCW
ncbi:putative lipoprotein [Pseudomonas aeruginosa]|nr:putative lipoprotein [Pseudomonas aeruginosa]